MSNNTSLLSLDSVSVCYGAIQAIDRVCFSVQQGEIVTLIGANGAGKTTILRAVSRLLPLSSGIITFAGQNLANVPAHIVVKNGLSHAPEGRGIFLNLTVEENLDLGAWTSQRKEFYLEDLEAAFTLFPRLKERRKQSAGTLSGGEQQMLAIARALMAHPKMLLLDEPSLGLAPQVIEKIFEIIVEINRLGKTVLLVEQNALQALQIANRGIILETGRIAAQGSASDLLKSDEIRRAYLGATSDL